MWICTAKQASKPDTPNRSSKSAYTHYVAETSQQNADDFYPGYAHFRATMGAERGWAPTSRHEFEWQRAPRGAYLIGSPEEVAEKIARHSEALGGISRVTFRMDTADLLQEKILRRIELIGSKVAPPL